MAKKGSNKQLVRATHKGRTARTTRTGYSASSGRGVRATGMNVMGAAKLTSPLITGHLSPTPKGPEPGRGGTMY